mgnify:FL=1|tara:strand:+ start:617 stop:1429 length:813 start_codon:yes stop_codon:yes gene_type:complete
MPTSITVITTMSNAGYHHYGEKMIDTFDKHWPENIKLKVYYEQLPTEKNNSERIQWIDLNEACPQLGVFKQRHANNPYANGRKPGTEKKPKRSYLWDAVKFSHKSYCVSHAALNADSDLVVWLDADVVTHSPVPESFIESLLPEDHYCAYLGRQKIYPECGFVIYDTRSNYNKHFMEDWQNMYQTDSLFKENEYHDSFLFWVLLQKYTSQGMQSFNISKDHPHRPGVHVFINSPLGAYMDHLKGKRKIDGHSKRTDIYIKHENDYWNKIQ